MATIDEFRLRLLERAEAGGEVLQFLRELVFHARELLGGEGGEVDCFGGLAGGW